MRHQNQTAVIECRVDIITLARLALYYTKREISIPTKSALARTVFENLAAVIDLQGNLPPVENLTDAIGTLEVLVFGNVHRSGRVLQQTMKKLAEETSDPRISEAIETFTKEQRGKEEL